MRSLAFPAALLLLAACARGGDNAAATDTTKAATPAAATMADFAGTWQLTGRNEAGDSIIATRLVVANDSFTVTLPDGRTVQQRMVSMAGDSVITEAGPYPSALRRGVQVRTHTIMRRNGDGLVGVVHATYALPGGDSTVTIRQTGTRVP